MRHKVKTYWGRSLYWLVQLLCTRTFSVIYSISTVIASSTNHFPKHIHKCIFPPLSPALCPKQYLPFLLFHTVSIHLDSLFLSNFYTKFILPIFSSMALHTLPQPTSYHISFYTPSQSCSSTITLSYSWFHAILCVWNRLFTPSVPRAPSNPNLKTCIIFFAERLTKWFLCILHFNSCPVLHICSCYYTESSSQGLHL